LTEHVYCVTVAFTITERADQLHHDNTNEVMKLDDLAEVTKLYCDRIYSGDTCAKALFMDAELSGNSNSFLCLGVYEPQQRCDLDTEIYNLSRLIPGKASRSFNCSREHTVGNSYTFDG
jgi:hypothetical protein